MDGWVHSRVSPWDVKVSKCAVDSPEKQPDLDPRHPSHANPNNYPDPRHYWPSF